MSKLEVIKVRWLNDAEAHMDPPGGDPSWWMRPVPKYTGGGEVWELNTGDDTDEAEGYFESPETALEYMSRLFDDAPVVITRDNR